MSEQPSSITSRVAFLFGRRASLLAGRRAGPFVVFLLLKVRANFNMVIYGESRNSRLSLSIPDFACSPTPTRDILTGLRSGSLSLPPTGYSPYARMWTLSFLRCPAFPVRPRRANANFLAFTRNFVVQEGFRRVNAAIFKDTPPTALRIREEDERLIILNQS